MKKAKGFTLIELVVVIVILGILAVTAAPKFLNLQSDARISALNGLKGALAGASGITYGKAAISGAEGIEEAKLDDTDIIYGYPKSSDLGIANVVDGLTGDDTGDWAEQQDDSFEPMGYVMTFGTGEALDENQIKDTNCYLLYQQATSSATPTMSVIKSGC